MKTHPPPIRSGLDFLRHVGFWVLVLVAVHVAYVLVDATFWPQPGRLTELGERLPFIVGLVLPVAVFAATSGRSGIFGGGDGNKSRVHLWIWVAVLAGAAYALTALVEPFFAPLTGSDALFPDSLDRASEAARAAARRATGPETEELLIQAGGYLTRLVVPFTTAAIVFVAAALGSLARIGLVAMFLGALRDDFRMLLGGLFTGACWAPLRVADLFASNLDLSVAGLFALLLAMHLALPLLIIAVLAVAVWKAKR